MIGRTLIVVDWKSREARVAIFAERFPGFELLSEFSTSTRCVICYEHSGVISNRAGADAVDIQEDERTIVFDRLGRDLSRIDDPELQTELLNCFWHELHQELLQRRILVEGQAAPVFVIPPVRFPPALLERFRVECAKETPLRLIGFINPAVALVLGFLRSAEVSGQLVQIVGQDQATVCLVVASGELTVDVVCFDYAFASPRQHRILVRDHFQTTCEGLLSRLQKCDWLGSFSRLVVIEDLTLPQSAQSTLNVPLDAISDAVTPHHRKLANASQLSLKGAAHVALSATGRAPDEQLYEIMRACHIGLQIDKQSFEPIIAKNSWKTETEFPLFAAQTFRVLGRPGDALRLNLYGGYSTRVADAVPLGQTMMAQEELAELTVAGVFTAVVRLDTPDSGEFVLGILPENRALSRQSFSLPGLVS